jgi:hypothetical protein
VFIVDVLRCVIIYCMLVCDGTVVVGNKNKEG